MSDEQDLVYRLHKRAEIRRSITTQKSADHIANLLEEAAKEIERLRVCWYGKPHE